MVLPGVLQAQERERINLFDRNPNTPRREIPWEAQRTSSEDMQRTSRSFQRAFDSDPRQTRREFLYYGIFLLVTAIGVAGFLGWQVWQRKRTERELNDPMFLIYELNSIHQLSEQEKRLMQELSERNSLPSPLKLFVEPKFLLDACESETFASYQTTARQLLSKLFDIKLVP